MGILDDAIREHLDLKRRQGAADSEIRRLEDEAFGPPSRPGEPDFPETGEQPAAAAVEVEADVAAQSEPPPSSESTFYDHDHGDPPPEAPDSAVPDEPPAEPPAETAVAPADEEPVAQVPLEMDDPAAHLEVLSEPASSPEPAGGEPPIESLDTVEHHFEDAIEDTGESQVVEAPPAEPAPATDEHAEADGEEDGEDVLEETPEFLRDQPEDDELWFEQGEPKDFDF